MSDLSISPTLKRILLEAIILTTFALSVGLMINYPLVMNAFTGKSVAATPVKQQTTKTELQTDVAENLFPDPVELDEIPELLAEGALLIDARNIEDYKAGHLRNAISFPIGEAEARIEAFQKEVPKERTLILYCNGFGCPDSFDLGVFLLQKGYQDVLAYEGGYPEWRDQGGAIEEGLK